MEGAPQGPAAVGKDAVDRCERASQEFTESLETHPRVNKTTEGQAWASDEDGL